MMPWGREECKTGLPASNSLEQQVERFRQDLAGFFGTEQWTRMPTLCKHFVVLTDGALYVAEHGGENGQSAYWLIDAIASYQGEPAFRRQDFQVWTLRVLPADPPEVAARSGRDQGKRPPRHRPAAVPSTSPRRINLPGWKQSRTGAARKSITRISCRWGRSSSMPVSRSIPTSACTARS